jgi:heterodisulfide reductase subunit A-like polyferredoxin
MIGEGAGRDKHVLVVGGGIGGITAALELASCGVRVTMVEAGPSIGGRMIQLDKTFPTLDCSTCTLSPKMVEVALNRNIDLLSWSRPVAIKREAAGFKVAVLKKSRFVDVKKCTACGACLSFCPVVMKSEFNMGTGVRRAAYIPFPQAIPNKASIDKRTARQCKAACIAACPVHTNVPGYLKHASEGRFEDAYLLIRRTNPFPSVCGRVCYAPCEEACNRGQIDEPIAIRDIKRAVVPLSAAPLSPQAGKTGKKAAVIGAGPAGLTCAFDLALCGHEVTVFEAMPEPGGMLRYAIPEYRLPKSELQKEIDYIRSAGVTIKCGVEVGKDIAMEKIMEDHDAVFLGTGAPLPVALGIPGEDSREVIDGLGFLRAVEMGEPMRLGKRIAVIGGGNTAVDCARTARRLGSDAVLLYRRTKEEMPALAEEVEALLSEGAKIEFLAAPVRFLSKEGGLTVECIRMELGGPDSTGRRSPVPVKGSEFPLSVDTVITALGQKPDASFAGAPLAGNGTVKIDPLTGGAGLPGLFAGGDAVTGPSYVIDAIAAGKRAAASMDLYMRGEDGGVVSPAGRTGEGAEGPQRLSDEEKARILSTVVSAGREPAAEEDPKTRVTDFREVRLAYEPEAMMREASRCLAGQVEGCIECGECERVCEVGAVDHAMKDETVELLCDGIILAPGFDLYDPTEKGEYGYGVLEGVMTGIEFERISSVTGPTEGEIIVNGKRPRRFFFIQCVGSRDAQSGARFCSRVCCMYTAKHASIVMERVKDAEVYVSYIDVRAYGKYYEEFYKSTQEAGARYIRGIPGEVTKGRNGLLVRVEDMLSDELAEIEVDLVVLATGVRPRKETAELCRMASLEPDPYGFVKVDAIAPSKTSVEGIFVCGMASGPKDVPDTVASAGEAASRCLEYMGR